MDRGRGGRSGTWRGAAGVDRDMGSRSRVKRHQAQVRAVEAGRSGRLSR